MEAHASITRFADIGELTGFYYACQEWGWTILDSWLIGDGYCAVLYVNG